MLPEPDRPAGLPAPPHPHTGQDPRRPRQQSVGCSYLYNGCRRPLPAGLQRDPARREKETAAAFWTRAQAFFTQAGITVERVLTDNGSCYRSRDRRDTLTAAGITHKRTRPYPPQTNGKVERFTGLHRAQNLLPGAVGQALV